MSRFLLLFATFIACGPLADLLSGSLGAGLERRLYGQSLEFKPGEHICIIGNGLGERMQHFGHLEALIHARFPQHELVFRNLAYSGDEVAGWQDGSRRLRSMSFGSQDEWLAGSAPVPQPAKLSKRDEGKVRGNRFELTDTRADVIFAFYGYNESYAGESGLPRFRQELTDFLKHTLGQKYNGKSAPRIVLFSPTPLELSSDPNLPNAAMVAATNARIKSYVAVMAEVAKENGVPFVDLFAPAVRGAFAKANAEPLTINGLHLNERGDNYIAELAYQGLFGSAAPQTSAALASLRKAVNDKNWYWFHRYRVTDGFSTYGDRAFLKFSEGPGGYGEGLSNYSVGQRELDVIDTLTHNRDRVVWRVARGEQAKAADDNLPEFIPVISNKPGPLPGGKHEFLTGPDSISKMTVGKNLKVELFADESMFPELANPVQMAFDTRGRLWVAAWSTYPHWKPTEPMDDKLLILEDTDHDGKADVCKTFAGDIHNPTGFEFWNNGVIVAQGPDIIYLRDTNGDDKYDIKERIVHGLDTADTHHTANSFVLDPGGALYFQEGTFHHTQVETPWGAPRRVANGAVFRFEPRTSKFDVYVTYGFANPHGHVFDRWGQDFVWDGTGANPFHAPLFSSDMDFPHKHAATPQVYQQRTRPCSGVEVMSSGHFPEEFQGNLLINNVIGFQGILRYKMEDKGSSFGATELEPILFSSDPNFRPTDLEIAPDGSIYFVDWHNPIIGHMQHNLRDPSRDRTHGRIYRVRYEGRELLKPAPVAGEPIERLLGLLKSPDDRVRSRARIELSGRRSDAVLGAARKWLAALDGKHADYEHHRLEGLWLHQNHNVVDEGLLKQVLRSPDFRARAAATRIVAHWRDRIDQPLELLRTQVNDENPRVRLMAIWSLSFFGGTDAEKAAEIAVESLVHPQDPYLKHLLDETNKTLDRRAKSTAKK
ncbi:MAG: azurin [Planctomycetes bacterium]|nr:azurin [Planctomycetota bacterium]